MQDAKHTAKMTIYREDHGMTQKQGQKWQDCF